MKARRWRMKRSVFFAFIVLLVLLLTGPLPAFGEGGEAEWVLLETDADGVSVYYDSASVSRVSGGRVSAALKHAYGEAVPSPADKGRSGHCVQTVEVKCLEESYRVLESRYYDEQGSLSEAGCPFPAGWQLTAGNLTMETLHKALCRPSRIETMPPWK
jgi:hypothetical protein